MLPFAPGRIQKMLYIKHEPCPKCKSEKILHSSSRWRHFKRYFIGSRRRYCSDCEHHWIGVDLKKRLVSRRTTAIVVLGVLMAMIVAALSTGSLNPVDWVKSQVVGYYDSNYGAEGKKKLWEHWGSMYGARSGAEADYGAHKN